MQTRAIYANIKRPPHNANSYLTSEATPRYICQKNGFMGSLTSIFKADCNLLLNRLQVKGVAILKAQNPNRSIYTNSYDASQVGSM